MQIRIDGAVRTHRDPDDKRCPGGGQLPEQPVPDNPHVAVLPEQASEWLRVFARSNGLSLSESLTFIACDYFQLPLPGNHPLAKEAS